MLPLLFLQLTSIKNLLGRQGGHFLLFGMLTRTADGSFALEDLDDKVELDLSEASPASGMFTEGCFALLDGLYTKESIFKVYEIGHPPSEKREVSRWAKNTATYLEEKLTFWVYQTNIRTRRFSRYWLPYAIRRSSSPNFRGESPRLLSRLL